MLSGQVAIAFWVPVHFYLTYAGFHATWPRENAFLLTKTGHLPALFCKQSITKTFAVFQWVSSLGLGYSGS